MKLIFLDIDGVLNSTEFFDRTNPSKTLEMQSDAWWAEMLDPAAVARLNRLLRETVAAVVVTSSWRLANPPKRLQAILELAGFDGQVIGSTEQLVGCPRGLEIMLYLTTLPRTPFVILDDAEDMAEVERYRVLIPFRSGLQDEHIERAKEVLSIPPAPLDLTRAVRAIGFR